MQTPSWLSLLVDTETKCTVAIDTLFAYAGNKATPHVSVDLEWYTPERGTALDEGVRTKSTVPCFVQVAILDLDAALLHECVAAFGVEAPSGTPIVVFLFDLITLEGQKVLLDAMARLMGTDKLTKVFWDCREDSWVLTHRLKVPALNRFIDAQLLQVLVDEATNVAPQRPGWAVGVTGLAKALKKANLTMISDIKDALEDPKAFTTRPLSEHSIAYMCGDVAGTLLLYERLLKQLPRHEDTRAKMWADLERGTQVYTTFSAAVPDRARRHGILAIGVLETVRPTPNNPTTCHTCTRKVSTSGQKSCAVCRKAEEFATRRRF